MFCPRSLRGADMTLPVIRLRLRSVVLCVAVSGLTQQAAAQGSRVSITVYQSPRSGATRPAHAAIVCFTSTDYSKYTDGYGMVSFADVPQGAWSAVAWKSGFRAKRADITVPATGTDVRATITLSEPSLAASPCDVPSGPVPMPAAEPGKVTLVISVFGAADGAPLQNAYACVGSDSSHPDSYAKRGYTDVAGRVVFHVDPVGRWE